MVKINFNLLRSKISELIRINKYYLTENYQEFKAGKKKIDYLKDYEECFNNYSPCFVLSTGRCGTMLLTKLLQQDKNTSVYHADYLVPSPLVRFFQNKAYQINDPEKLIDIFEAIRSETIYRTYRTDREYIETNSRITFFAYAIKLLFPKSKFVHVIRDPSKIVVSFMRRNRYKNEEIVDIGLLRMSNSDAWNKLTLIEKIGWMWNETHQFIEDFKKEYPSDVITVKAEDLFKSVETNKLIFDFTGAQWPGDKRIEKMISKPVNKQMEGSYPRYQDWQQEDKEALKRIAPLFSKYGYKL